MSQTDKFAASSLIARQAARRGCHAASPLDRPSLHPDNGPSIRSDQNSYAYWMNTNGETSNFVLNSFTCLIFRVLLGVGCIPLFGVFFQNAHLLDVNCAFSTILALHSRPRKRFSTPC